MLLAPCMRQLLPKSAVCRNLRLISTSISSNNQVDFNRITRQYIKTVVQLTTCEEPPIEKLIEVETHLLSGVHKIPIPLRMQILSAYNDRRRNSALYRKLLSSMGDGSAEISKPKHLVSLFYYALQNGKPEMIRELEKDALRLCHQFSVKDCYKIVFVLNQNKSRNTKLLYALAKCMCDNKLAKLSISQLVSLTKYCANLSFYYRDLLQEISSAIQNLETNSAGHVDAVMAAQMLRSLSTLRWSDPPLMEVLTRTVTWDDHEIVNSVMTSCAHLNHMPTSLHSYCATLEGDAAKWEDHPHLRLGVVWSLAILNQLTPDLAKSVLRPEFIKSLQDTLRGQTLLQLVQVDAAARWDLTNYDGPMLEPEFWENHKLQVCIRERKPVSDQVAAVLNHIAPSPNFCKRNITTSQGYHIDFELLVNEKGEPQSLTEAETGSGTSAAPLYRVAVKVLEFPDVLSSQKPTGTAAMATRHLFAMGYATVMEPHDSFGSVNKKLVKQLQHLQKKIRSALQYKTSHASTLTDASSS